MPTLLKSRALTFNCLNARADLNTLQHGLRGFFASSGPRRWIDEWIIGIDWRKVFDEQIDKEIGQALSNPKVQYIDYFTPVYDHVSHLNRDHDSQLNSLEEIDNRIGRLWTAIRTAPNSEHTVLVLLSDHGMNTHEEIYSQGYSLIDLFRSRVGGGHHVVTKRPPLADYSLKSLNPVSNGFTSPSSDSYYLAGKSDDYPTALLDVDGNERASIYLRNDDFNQLQVLWRVISKPALDPGFRKIFIEAFFAIINRHRQEWQKTLTELEEELAAFRRDIRELEPLAVPKKVNGRSQQGSRPRR